MSVVGEGPAVLHALNRWNAKYLRRRKVCDVLVLVISFPAIFDSVGKSPYTEEIPSAPVKHAILTQINAFVTQHDQTST